MAVNPVGVMKRFMMSMIDTGMSDSGINLAVRAASNGKFWTYNACKNNFLSALSSAYNKGMSVRTFLKKYCGIDLSNRDTGAITGYDAGVSKKQFTSSSIVRNLVPLSQFALPKKSYSVIEGLKVVWPKLSGLSAKEKYIVKGLNSSWIKASLQLIKKSYGLAFGPDVCSTLKVKFVSVNDNRLAWLSDVWVNGKAKGLTLYVNKNLDIDMKSVDGWIGGYENDSQDKVICHELVHALMHASINNGYKMSNFLEEGFAELVVGVDDTRYNTLEQILSKENFGKLKMSMGLNTKTFYSEAMYAGSVAFLRYLAKNSLVDGYRYMNAKKTALALTSSFKGTYNMQSWKGVSQVDARGNSNTIVIKGTAKADKIYVGKQGNKVVAGSGDDIIYVSSGQGHKVYGQNGKDSIFVKGGTASSIQGQDGVDTICVTGGSGNKLYGQNGNDVIEVKGGFGNRYYGGAGNDTFTVHGGNQDIYFGGDGVNRLVIDSVKKKTVGFVAAEGSRNRIVVDEVYKDFQFKLNNNNTVSMISDIHRINISGMDTAEVVVIFGDHVSKNLMSVKKQLLGGKL